MELGQLIINLKQPFHYLVKRYQLGSEDKEDTMQELYCMVVEYWDGNEDKGVGWWCTRARWFLLNRLRKAYNDPLDNVNKISLDYYQGVDEEVN